MNCKVASEYIHQYLDGELENNQYLQLQEHLKACSDCMNKYEQLERTDALSKFALQSTLKSERKEADVMRLNQAILAHLPTKPRNQSKAKFVRWLYRYPGLTAAAMFLIVMVISMFSAWDQDTKLMISGSQDTLQHIVIEGNTVIVPEGTHLTGDLVVENGIVEVKGAVDGNVTVIDGQMVLASTGHIAGQSKVIDQALDWFWYKVTSSISEVIPQ